MEIDLLKLITESQNRITVEDLELLERVCDRSHAKTILEIGSAAGGSSVVLALKARERGGRLYCIEPFPKQRMVDNMKQYGLSDHYTMIAGSSPWFGQQEVPLMLDLLFIDGYHETRWALVDYHYWAPRVRPGGIIVFHDTGGGSAEDRRRPEFGQPGYVPLVMRAIEIILQTDDLEQVDRSDTPKGGAIAFVKTGQRKE